MAAKKCGIEVGQRGRMVSRNPRCRNRTVYDSEDEALVASRRSRGPWSYEQYHCEHCERWHNVRTETRLCVVQTRPQGGKWDGHWMVIERRTGEVLSDPIDARGLAEKRRDELEAEIARAEGLVN